MTILIILLYLVLVVGSLTIWVWMLVDCAAREPSTGNDKIVWILIILFFGPIGALIYYAVRRPKRRRLYGA